MKKKKKPEQVSSHQADQAIDQDVTGELGRPNIKGTVDEEIWSSAIDIGTENRIEVSLIKKGKLFYSEQAIDSDVDNLTREQNIYSIVPMQETSPFDTRLNKFYSMNFIASWWNTIKANSIIKAIGSILIFIFGPMTELYKYYLAMASIAVFLGACVSSKQKTLSLTAINTLIMGQIFMLIAVGAIHIGFKALMDQDILGGSSLLLKNVVIIWFILHNLSNILKYLVDLGVPVPASWREKIQLIKTLNE